MHTPEPDDDYITSEDELQYDEAYEDSDNSGSDYEEVPDSEEETLMINAAIEASHKTARLETQERSGAGPSTSRSSTTSRVALGKMRIVESDEEFYGDSACSDDLDESELSHLDGSDDDSSPKTKGKAKAEPKKGKPSVSREFLSWAEKRRRARLEQREVKREHRLLAKKLGRPLTQVRPRISDQIVSAQYIYSRRTKLPWH